MKSAEKMPGKVVEVDVRLSVAIEMRKKSRGMLYKENGHDCGLLDAFEESMRIRLTVYSKSGRRRAMKDSAQTWWHQTQLLFRGSTSEQ